MRLLPLATTSLLALLTIAAGPFHSRDGWTLDLPAGSALAPEVLSTSLRARPSSANFTYTDAWHLKALSSNGAFPPYLLAQMTEVPMARASLADIEKEFGDSGALARSFASAQRTTGVGIKSAIPPKWDPVRKRVTMTLDLTIAGAASRAYCVLNMGKDSITQLNFYSDLKTFDAELPQFQKIADSFQFDPGYQWTPATSPLGKIGSSVVLYGAIGAVVGGIVAVARRKKAAPKVSPTPTRRIG